jgi:hypothetical protein
MPARRRLLQDADPRRHEPFRVRGLARAASAKAANSDGNCSSEMGWTGSTAC